MGWSEGVVRLMGLESNKAAHHIKVCEPSDTRITHIGWATCNISNKNPKTTRDHGEDAFTKDFGLREDGGPVNLPQALTFVEVDTALPKISPLPSGSAGAGYTPLLLWLPRDGSLTST